MFLTSRYKLNLLTQIGHNERLEMAKSLPRKPNNPDPEYYHGHGRHRKVGVFDVYVVIDEHGREKLAIPLLEMSPQMGNMIHSVDAYKQILHQAKASALATLEVTVRELERLKR